MFFFIFHSFLFCWTKLLAYLHLKKMGWLDAYVVSRLLRKIILNFLFIILINFHVNSQGLNNLWLLGYDSYTSPGWGGTDIDFFSGMPFITSHQRTMNFTVCNGSISNQQGGLLFYTNGCFVANAADSVMENGDSLIYGPFANDYCQYGSPFVQGALILPLPSSDSLYYLFHEDVKLWPLYINPTQLLLSIIDMSQDNGKGKLIQKSTAIYNDTLVQGQLSAVKHANGRDWWVMCHQSNTDQFIVLLLTPEGISLINTQHVGSAYSTGISQVCFSPDGNKMARYNVVEGLDIFDFDRCTGFLSNLVHTSFNDSAFTAGVSFSPSSQFLYVFSSYHIYQYDVTSSNILNTKTTVATYDSFASPFPSIFFLCQLAIDGRIYGSSANSVNFLHVINYPDSNGTSCNVTQHGIALPTYHSQAVPNYPNYFLGPVSGSVCDSLTGMDEYLNEIKNFTVRPNPSNGHFSISYLLPQNKSGSFEVYDAIGNVIFKMSLPSWSTLQQISLPKLAPGIYHSVISSGGYSVSKKIVVMRE
jgi:hypothetical protein